MDCLRGSCFELEFTRGVVLGSTKHVVSATTANYSPSQRVQTEHLTQLIVQEGMESCAVGEIPVGQLLSG